MKNVIIWLWILSVIFASLITGYFTKKYYQVEYKPPIAIHIPNTIPIKPIEGTAQIVKEYVKVPFYIHIKDSSHNENPVQVDSQKIDVMVAKLDTFVQYRNKVTYLDTTFTNYDTLALKIKYFFPPLNKFVVSPTIRTTNIVLKERKPEEKFLDRFQLGIGIGYASPFKSIEISPSIFVGIFYTIKVSIF
jgi:hypothetical protein